MVNMAVTSKTGTKHKPLSVSVKLNIINKMNGLPSVPCTKILEQLAMLAMLVSANVMR